MDYCVLLQGIFPPRGSNPHLLHFVHWQVGSLLLVPPEKPLKGLKIFICSLKKFFLSVFIYACAGSLLLPKGFLWLQ